MMDEMIIENEAQEIAVQENTTGTSAKPSETATTPQTLIDEEIKERHPETKYAFYRR